VISTNATVLADKVNSEEYQNSLQIFKWMWSQ